jgi:competence protein ComFC
VQLLKYHRMRAAAPELARLLSPLLTGMRFDAITSVPIATDRYRQRGYNQADLLARRLASTLGLPYTNLVRRRRNSQQVGHSRSQRLSQVEGAFAPLPQSIIGQNILIIDDVITTGATLNECAKVLRGMGARQVWGAVAAKH